MKKGPKAAAESNDLAVDRAARVLVRLLDTALAPGGSLSTWQPPVDESPKTRSRKAAKKRG